MRRWNCAAGVVSCMALFGCAVAPPDRPALAFDRGRLPPPDVSLAIPGLGPCTDDPDRTLHLTAGQPVTVFVHGCYDSAGLFRSMAEVFAFHGQQTACFDYDYRDSLTHSATQLRDAVDSLGRGLGDARITILGHSQGGLISRASVAERLPRPDPHNAGSLRLVTVSAPYGGIASAGACGWAWLNVATVGLNALACWAVSGDKWYEITSSSGFIREPGALLPSVESFLKVDTDESGSCRRRGPEGDCAEDDYVFSLAEQHNAAVEDRRTTSLSVAAGHVEIVGDREVVPEKLIALLQGQGILRPTPPDRRAELEQLLAALFGK